jgi:hypothetical protein
MIVRDLGVAAMLSMISLVDGSHDGLFAIYRRSYLRVRTCRGRDCRASLAKVMV